MQTLKFGVMIAIGLIGVGSGMLLAGIWLLFAAGTWIEDFRIIIVRPHWYPWPAPDFTPGGLITMLVIATVVWWIAWEGLVTKAMQVADRMAADRER